MKKILALAALVLGLASCQTEPVGLNVNVGGEVDTYITVALPEATRANSADGFDLNNLGDYRLRYILEIYRVEDEQVLYSTCQRFVETSDNTSMVFPVRRAQNYDYRIVAWTDIVEGESKEDRYYYTAAGLDEIAIRDNGTVNWNAMDETRDAYTCVKVVDNFTSASDLDMTLTRPFAKVRVVTTDIEDIRKVGLEPKSATVEYAQDMFFKYNAVAETYAHTNSKSHNISYPATPVYEDATGEMTLFADYIFVPSTGTAKFSLNVYADANQSKLIKSNNFNTEIFVERNKLTTIKGDVLTVGGNVEVKIDNNLSIKETYELVDNAESLQDAIDEIDDNEVGNIVLGGDIDLGDLLIAGTFATRAEKQYGLEVPAGKVVNLDLNGYTISQEKACTASYSMILNNGNLTITGNSDGKIEFTNTAEGGGSDWGTYTIENRGEGVLTIDNVTIRHKGCVNGETNRDTNIAIQNYQGKVVINGGTIASTQFRSLRDFTAGGEIIINGGTFLGQVWMQGLGNGSSSLTINGGNFSPVVGYDGSSVYITNNSNIVNVAVNGGMFNTKIGCYDANKEGAKGCIVAGTFTTAAKEDTNEALIDSDYTWSEPENDTWTLVRKPNVAKIGEVGYTSLQKAVAAVQDGETITLEANETFTEKNYYDNGGWKDGLGYAGDKSFTIDLNGKTVSQNGALNDYLIWVKNVGSKANTITIKNGTLDAGTTAYCALCTASSHDNQLTINLENVNLINNKYDGSTVRARAGSVINVKAGTKITGKDSYLGIENWKATVNIYDGAEIYMNGTSSYNGCLVGVGGNGTINVYGGYGKGVKGGFIAMTSGGTINVAGGEWIANTNGSIGNNSNLYVLTAQSNKYESGFAGPSIINVTGGTFRGGMDAWVLNDVTVEKAELNISGGNFNANPTNFLAEGCEANETNGIWTVRVLPVAKIGSVEYTSFEEAVEAVKAGDTITLLRDITLAEELGLPAGIIFNGNGKQINGTIYADGNLTFAGHTKVTAFSASYYNRVITIGEGACLEVTGTGRVTLGYGNTFNITGSIENAKETDKATIQPSLIIPAGISITGGNGATMNVTNAYVKIGSTSSKPGVANGTFTLNFNNAIAEFTKEFGFYDPTGGVNPTFVMNIKDSVFTTGTKLYVTAGSTVTVDNSNVPLGTYFRNSGAFTLKNGSVMTGSTIQFGENGGNNGTINVDASTLTITTGNNKGHAFDGKDAGIINATNGATVSVEYYKAMTINVDATSTFIGTEVQ